MKLFLIRHGETVDNVAGLYAGTRDSQLTSHGVQQASRLGRFLHSRGVALTHILSSDLQRAVKTAELVKGYQSGNVEHVKLTVLREQDFGSLEGKSVFTRIPEGKVSTLGQLLGENAKDETVFVDMESKAAMANRMDSFLDNDLFPLLSNTSEASQKLSIAIVSHGLILGVLWKRLLLRLPTQSVALAPQVLATGRPVALEHLGGWSNTGYLELNMFRTTCPTVAVPLVTEAETVLDHVAVESKVAIESTTPLDTPEKASGKHSGAIPSSTLGASASPIILKNWNTTVLAINRKEHLTGLKRTGGGVGSARYDESQKTIDNFFKRRKVG